MSKNFRCGDRLRELRVQKQMSQEELAFQAELSTAYVGMIERGTKNPTIRVLERLCEALEIELYQFFLTDAHTTPSTGDELPPKLLALSPEEHTCLL